MTVIARPEVVLEGNDRPLSRALDRAEGKMSASGARMERIARRAGQASAVAIAAIGAASIKAAIDMERLELSLGVTAGSADAAASQMKDLERIARLPGLGFREAIEGANQLNVAFSDLPNATERSTRTLAAFGRAVALTGGGRAELQRVITQVTQIASAGKLLQQDLRPIIQTAPAVGQALKNAFGTISPQEIEALGLSTEQFLTEMVVALEALPEPAETTANALENLSDSAFRAAAAMGEMFIPAITTGATFLADQLERAAGAMERIHENRIQPGDIPTAEQVMFLETGAMGGDPRDAGLNISGRGATGANQFLSGRSGMAELVSQSRAREEALRLEAEAQAKLNDELREAGIETVNLTDRIAFLNTMVVDLGDVQVEWARNLDVLDLNVRRLEQDMGVLNIELDEEAVKANAAAVAVLALSKAQEEASRTAQKLGAGIGVLGGLGGLFGVQIPFLSNLSSGVSAFMSALPFFAHGGRLDAGMFGIAGEAGMELVGRPTLIKGPAEIAPIGEVSGSTTVAITLPPPRTPFDFARDQDWLRVLNESNLNLQVQGA